MNSLSALEQIHPVNKNSCFDFVAFALYSGNLVAAAAGSDFGFGFDFDFDFDFAFEIAVVATFDVVEEEMAEQIQRWYIVQDRLDEPSVLEYLDERGVGLKVALTLMVLGLTLNLGLNLLKQH
jgi:hypothetical protein